MDPERRERILAAMNDPKVQAIVAEAPPAPEGRYRAAAGEQLPSVPAPRQEDRGGGVMADLAPLTEPTDWPDVLPDWDSLSPAAQHGLMAR